MDAMGHRVCDFGRCAPRLRLVAFCSAIPLSKKGVRVTRTEALAVRSRAPRRWILACGSDGTPLCRLIDSHGR